MDFLRGIMSLIPGNGSNAKAIRLLTEEFKSYNNRMYHARFELNDTITITEKDFRGKTVEVDISYGKIQLDYVNQDEKDWVTLYQTYRLFGRWKNGYYKGHISIPAHRIKVWRSGIYRIDQVLFNEEVERFRQAFLSDDPIVHDQIHAAILEAVRKPAGHACA